MEIRTKLGRCDSEWNFRYRRVGGCSRGDRTLLDALYPVYESLKDKRADSEVGMECLVQAAKDGAEDTSNLEAQAGRARYVEGKGVGKVDPGAFAVYLLLKALE